MTLTLSGNNSFALQQRLKELTSEFADKYGEFALQKIDGEEAETQAVLDAISALPFLSEQKMIVVRNLSSNKALAEQIEQIISSTPETTSLIIYEPVTDKRTGYYKYLKAKTEFEEYTELDAHSLAKWLSDEAKKRGGELKSSDGAYLVERVGTNQMLLSNELDKLITYNPKIDRSAIDELVEATPQTKIFELLDAAFGGDKKRALKIYEEQRAQKVEPQAIMSMVAWQLQILALAKLGQGKLPGQIASDAKLNPYPITKAQRLVSNLSMDKLREIIDEALEMDWRSKTSAIDLDEALKTYIVTL